VARSYYASYARLFDYPGLGFNEKILHAHSVMQENHPEAASELEHFVSVVSGMELWELEELFGRSFDVQSATTLDVGYVLFADDYKRGELLANLNGEHRRCGNDCGTELADHLPNLLRMMAKLDDPELIKELVEEIIAPALKKMIGEFEPKRTEQREKVYQKHYRTVLEAPRATATAYQSTLKALRIVLKSDFSISEKMRPWQSNDFLRVISTEMTLEDG
jgi:nitrate reductase assembly molybdenum cofactor insertion protein NarJ